MADNTGIEWVVALARSIDAIPATWNTIDGCSRQSEGCRNCWSAALVHSRLSRSIPGRYAGLTELEGNGVPRFNGTVRLHEPSLTIPLAARKPRVYFAPSMADPFHPELPDGAIDRIMAVMALCPQHVFLVLTKRPERMRAYLSTADRLERIAAAAGWMMEDGDGALDTVRGGPWPIPNVWLGCTVEDQPTANARHPDMQAIAAAGWRTFVSYEPALGPWTPTGWEFLSWLIAGGEDGPAARAPHQAWFLGARDWCARNGVPFLFKQWGAWSPDAPRDKEGALKPVETHAIANDGTLYRLSDLAYPDGPRRGEAIRAGHDKAALHTIYHVGKKTAGRLLEDVLHDAVPDLDRAPIPVAAE